LFIWIFNLGLFYYKGDGDFSEKDSCVSFISGRFSDNFYS